MRRWLQGRQLARPPHPTQTPRGADADGATTRVSNERQQGQRPHAGRTRPHVSGRSRPASPHSSRRRRAWKARGGCGLETPGDRGCGGGRGGTERARPARGGRPPAPQPRPRPPRGPRFLRARAPDGSARAPDRLQGARSHPRRGRTRFRTHFAERWSAATGAQAPGGTRSHPSSVLPLARAGRQFGSTRRSVSTRRSQFGAREEKGCRGAGLRGSIWWYRVATGLSPDT